MKRIFLFCLFCLTCLCCTPHTEEIPGSSDNETPGEYDFVGGADISWCTEQEAGGKKFYNKDGVEMDIFSLMKDIGMRAIRLRVWNDPTTYGYGPWSDKADVLAKSKRAHDLGLDLMIDFHYSDFFADPGKQKIPKAWEGMTKDEVAVALADYTKDVLQTLKDEGVTPKWVQIGNETNNGMVHEFGTVHWERQGMERFKDYVLLNNSGYDAVKSIFPNAYVIVHLAGADNPQWFFSDFKAAGGKFDMIGVSHYPTVDEWNSTGPNATHSNINAEKWIKEAIGQFDVPVMVCETGFDVNQPVLANQVMADLFERLKNVHGCHGIFYWEPQVDGVWKPKYYETLGWVAYTKGAFIKDGRPTQALDAFCW